MHLNTYQDKVMRTAPRSSKLKSIELQHAIYGMMTELGEFVDPIKKELIYKQGSEGVYENLVEELGDILWYLTLAANSLGVELEDVARANISKLEKRYPTKFTEKDAIERADKRGEE